jgi:hypothetical protein
MPTNANYSDCKTLQLDSSSLHEYPERLGWAVMGDEEEERGGSDKNCMDDMQLSYTEIGLELCTALLRLLRGNRSSDNNNNHNHKHWKTIRLFFCTGRVDVILTAILTLDNCECLEIGDFVADEPVMDDIMMGDGDDDSYNSHEALYFALAMGLPSTRTLKTLRIHGGVSRQASVLFANGIRSCTSLETVELVDLLPVNEEASNEMTQGILNNTSLQHIILKYSFPTLLQASILYAWEEMEEHRSISLDLFFRKGACPPIIMQACARLLLANRVRKLVLERVRVDRDYPVAQGNHFYNNNNNDTMESDNGLNIPLLAHALESNTSLKELNIANNCIRDVELGYLIRALRKNKALEQVDLSLNDISDAGKRCLAEALPSLHLKRLLVQENLVEEDDDDSGTKELLSAMRRNFNLEILGVDPVFDGFEEVRLLGRLNRGGRRVLLDRNFPLSLWPKVLERTNRLTFKEEGEDEEHAYDNLSGRAEIIYFLLHGVPNLVEQRRWTT